MLEGLGALRWRLVFAVLGCFGMAIIYGLKVNLHVNIVAMLNHTAIAERAAEAEGAHGGHGGGHEIVADGKEEEEVEEDLCYGPGSPVRDLTTFRFFHE